MKDVLTKFADSQEVSPVFGAERAIFRDDLITALRGIKPTEGQLIEHGFNGWNARRITAYRNGVQHLKNVYNTTSPELPEL